FPNCVVKAPARGRVKLWLNNVSYEEQELHSLCRDAACTGDERLGNGALCGCQQRRPGAAVHQLNHCTLTGNSATIYGCGVYWGTLNNCTLSGNSARVGGGAAGIYDVRRLQS